MNDQTLFLVVTKRHQDRVYPSVSRWVRLSVGEFVRQSFHAKGFHLRPARSARHVPCIWMALLLHEPNHGAEITFDIHEMNWAYENYFLKKKRKEKKE